MELTDKLIWVQKHLKSVHHFSVMHIFHELFEDLPEGKRREGQTSRDWPPPAASVGKCETTPHCTSQTFPWPLVLSLLALSLIYLHFNISSSQKPPKGGREDLILKKKKNNKKKTRN